MIRSISLLGVRILDAIVGEVAKHYGILTAVIYRSSRSSLPGYVKSLHHQEDVCFDHCITENIIVLDDFYNDEDGQQNYGLLEAIDFCEETHVDYFIVKDLSRIAGSYAEIRNVAKKLQEHGTRIIPIQGSTKALDSLLSSPFSREVDTNQKKGVKSLDVLADGCTHRKKGGADDER